MIWWGREIDTDERAFVWVQVAAAPAVATPGRGCATVSVGWGDCSVVIRSRPSPLSLPGRGDQKSSFQPFVINQVLRRPENQSGDHQHDHEQHPRHRAGIAHLVELERLAVEI